MSGFDMELMRETARVLTRRDVRFRFEPPKSEVKSYAAMIVGADGVPVIDIDPAQVEAGSDWLFHLYTHELAHVVLHAPIMKRVETSNPAARYKSESKHVSSAANQREIEAEELAERWRNFAAARWRKYNPQRNYFHSLLMALKEYKP